jgi:hypothetical protein
MSVGREEDAIASLARLHAHGDIHDPFVVNEAAEIKAGVLFDKQAEQGWKKVSLATCPIEPSFPSRSLTPKTRYLPFSVGPPRQVQPPSSLYRSHAPVLGPDDRCLLYPVLLSPDLCRHRIRQGEDLLVPGERRHIPPCSLDKTNSIAF